MKTAGHIHSHVWDSRKALGEDVYLPQLTIKNFRRISEATLLFRPGLNVIVGPNNIGKTAVIDGLCASCG